MSAQVLRLRDHRPVTDLTPDEARTLTDEIKADVANLLPKIKQAFERRADVALGYTNWVDYCDQELRGLRLPVSERRAAVTDLRQTGMSTRAIGAALGVADQTVRADLAALRETTQLPERITGLDGRERPAARPTDVPAGPAVASPPAASEPPNRPGTQVTPVGADGGVGVTRDAGTDAAPRPKPPAWDPEERRQHEEEVRRVQDIEAARRTAKTIVTEVRSLVVTVVAGSRLGEKGLVTPEMIADLRKAIDLLEGEL